MKRAWLAGRLFALALVWTSVVACSTSDVPKFVPVAGRAPEISGDALLGGSVVPNDYRDKVLVVNFWNYDCPPCHVEQPVLQADWGRLKARGVFFVGLMYVGGKPAYPNNPGAARSYLRRFGVTYPAVVDARSDLARRFGILGIPSTIVVDRNGEMRYVLLGRVRPGALEEVLGRLGV
jgi:cytochrome c biogenesis protein CcmG, thiol:disulfide interchange protein DsbE